MCITNTGLVLSDWDIVVGDGLVANNDSPNLELLFFIGDWDGFIGTATTTVGEYSRILQFPSFVPVEHWLCPWHWGRVKLWNCNKCTCWLPWCGSSGVQFFTSAVLNTRCLFKNNGLGVALVAKSRLFEQCVYAGDKYNKQVTSEKKNKHTL